MIIKNRTTLEIEVNGRNFRLECASESNWEEVEKATSMMNQYSLTKIEEIKLAQEKAQSESKQESKSE